MCLGNRDCAARRDQLLSKGRANVSALRRALQREQLKNHVKAARIKAACWDTTATPQAVIVPVSQNCLTTGLGEFEPSDEMVTRFAIWSLGPVQNMPISKLSAEEARRLQQVRNLSYWLHAFCVQRKEPMCCFTVSTDRPVQHCRTQKQSSTPVLSTCSMHLGLVLQLPKSHMQYVACYRPSMYPVFDRCWSCSQMSGHHSHHY